MTQTIALSPTHLSENSSPVLKSQVNRSVDPQIRFSGSWEHFLLIRQGLSESRKVKVSFYNEIIEILMLGAAHAKFTQIISYLVTTFLLENGILFVPSGDKDQAREGIAGLQADTSYCLGEEKEIPDLSIEVVFTSGGSHKLSIYEALGVPEVWFWEDGVLSLYHLRSPIQVVDLGLDSPYEKITVSELPGFETLDIDLLQRCILKGETDFPGAVAMLRSQTS